MIFKNFILSDNKLVLYTFTLCKRNNQIIIDYYKKNNASENNILKVSIYNKYSGLLYEPVCFPLIMNIYDDSVISNYFILSSLSMNIDNELNFFYSIKKCLQEKYSLQLVEILFTNQIKSNEHNLINKYINNYKINTAYKSFDDLICKTLYNIEFIKSYILYNILLYSNKKACKKSNVDNICKIIYNKSLSNKIYTPNIIDITNKEYIIYSTYTNIKFVSYIISLLLNISYEDAVGLYNYYYINNLLSDVSVLYKKFNQDTNIIRDLTILKNKSYDIKFFDNIIELYSKNTSYNILILTTLFNTYTYPLNISRHEIDVTFDYILYYSLRNYKILFSNNDIKQQCVKIIPMKIKHLFLSLIEILYNVMNDNFIQLINNNKYYYDYLHKTIIKIFAIQNSNNHCVKYFYNNIKKDSYEKFKYILSSKVSLIDISTKLSWNNITTKLNYLDVYYRTSNYGINTHLVEDYRIKKILESPFNMYKYLKSEKDFITWTHFISSYIHNIFYTPIDELSFVEISIIGKLIYLFCNIKYQTIQEYSYITFVNFFIKHKRILMLDNKINFNFKLFYNIIKIKINIKTLNNHILYT